MDFFSKWPESEAVKSKSAETVTMFLYEIFCWYTLIYLVLKLMFICRFEGPQHTISDQGREFVNQIDANLFTLAKTTHRISSAYHLQMSGLFERHNTTLQCSLIKLVNENQTDWDGHLDGVLKL